MVDTENRRQDKRLARLNMPWQFTELGGYREGGMN